MAYTSWSVVFGEQPSAAKWNILGTNDASFNDGSGFAAGALGSVNASVAAGFVVQQAYAELGTSSTTTTVLPADTTVPQNTEGAEILTVSITPKSATNQLLVEVNTMLLVATDTISAVAAIFRDTTADAIAAGMNGYDTTEAQTLAFAVRVSAGSTSATTFKLRVGPGAAATLRWNGVGAAYFGSIPKTTLAVTEVKA